jgi:hypothetical protein
MSDLTMSCPHCGFTRTLPAEQVPARPVRATCPRCRQSFSYRKPASDATPPQTESSPLPPIVPAGADERPGLEAAERTAGPLRGLGELFRDTWDIYIRRIGVLMGLYLLALLFMLLAVGLFTLVGFSISVAIPDLRPPLLVAGILTGVVLGSIVLFWGLAALVFAVADENLGIQAALEKGWRRVWAFAWVFSLSGFIVTGGFLLLVIPGIIFSVWFLLSQFVLVAEDERGMCALLKSKAYIEGRFFEVFLRLFVVWVVSAMIGMVPVLGPVLSILFVPFIMLYSWLIYVDLRSKSGKIPYACTSGEKATWLGIGALGFLIVPLSLLLLAIGWLGQSLSALTQPWRWFGF